MLMSNMAQTVITLYCSNVLSLTIGKTEKPLYLKAAFPSSSESHILPSVSLKSIVLQ